MQAPVLMSTTAHVGAVQTAGRPLRTMVSEDDEVAWEQALAAPAHHAAYVIAMVGDPVAKAVAAHPQGLKELEVICTTGQPCAKVYQSEEWAAQTTR
jgi:Na+-translocating ferredoxin:NAD+ oxidoreductase RnfC subunit